MSWEFVRDPTTWRSLDSAITSYGKNQSNTMLLVDPESIGSIVATIQVQDVDINNAWASTRLAGTIYNDGTGQDGLAGDIIAEVGIGHDGENLVGYYAVTRCLSGGCNNPGELEYLETNTGFFNPIVGRQYALLIDWDPQSNTILFKYSDLVEGNIGEATVDPLPAVGGPPKRPYKGMGTRVSQMTSPDQYGYISGYFSDISFSLLSLNDNDGDGIIDVYDPDDDNDGLDDADELILGTKPANSRYRWRRLP
jgi:hypothetical protein